MGTHTGFEMKFGVVSKRVEAWEFHLKKNDYTSLAVSNKNKMPHVNLTKFLILLMLVTCCIIMHQNNLILLVNNFLDRCDARREELLSLYSQRRKSRKRKCPVEWMSVQSVSIS